MNNQTDSKAKARVFAETCTFALLFIISIPALIWLFTLEPREDLPPEYVPGWEIGDDGELYRTGLNPTQPNPPTMAKLTLAGTSADKIPAAPGRKALVFVLESGTCVYGLGQTVTADGASDAGIPLTVGSPIAIAGELERIAAGAIPLAGNAGSVVKYTERF